MIKLTKAQHNMLCELISEFQGDLGSTIELRPEDTRVAKALDKKGILNVEVEDYSNGYRECHFTDKFVNLAGWHVLYLYRVHHKNADASLMVDAWLKIYIVEGMSTAYPEGENTIREKLAQSILRPLQAKAISKQALDKPDAAVTIKEPEDLK